MIYKRGKKTLNNNKSYITDKIFNLLYGSIN